MVSALVLQHGDWSHSTITVVPLMAQEKRVTSSCKAMFVLEYTKKTRC